MQIAVADVALAVLGMLPFPDALGVGVVHDNPGEVINRDDIGAQGRDGRAGGALERGLRLLAARLQARQFLLALLKVGLRLRVERQRHFHPF